VVDMGNDGDVAPERIGNCGGGPDGRGHLSSICTAGILEPVRRHESKVTALGTHDELIDHLAHPGMFRRRGDPVDYPGLADSTAVS
jgi:hypothetical protein